MEDFFTYIFLIFSKLLVWETLLAAAVGVAFPVLSWLKTKFIWLHNLLTRLAFLENSKGIILTIIFILFFYVSFLVYEDLRTQSKGHKNQNEVITKEKDIAKHDLAMCVTNLQTTCPENADETKKHLSYLILKDSDKLAIINFLRNFKTGLSERKDFEVDIYYYDEDILSLRAKSLIEALKLSNWGVIDKKGSREKLSLPKGITITWVEDPQNKEVSLAARGLADILSRIGLAVELNPKQHLIRDLGFNSMIVTIGD